MFYLYTSRPCLLSSHVLGRIGVLDGQKKCGTCVFDSCLKFALIDKPLEGRRRRYFEQLSCAPRRACLCRIGNKLDITDLCSKASTGLRY